MLLRKALNSFVAVVLFAGGAAGQSITAGTVRGVVTDPSGGVVPGAAVALTNTETDVTRKTMTNGEGRYQFGFAAPGLYRVEVTAKGFQKAERGGVTVTAGQPVGADIELEVAGPDVVVTEATQLIQTENADVSTDYNAETILNLPN